jgi:flagellar motor switch protein FliN
MQMKSEGAAVHILSTASEPQPGSVAQIISLGELYGEPAQRPPADSEPLHEANPLHAVRARLNVSVGSVEITVGELLSAKQHQVLVLNQPIDQPVDLLLEGKVVARGQLVAVDGNFAVRISEVAAQLKP